MTSTIHRLSAPAPVRGRYRTPPKKVAPKSYPKPSNFLVPLPQANSNKDSSRSIICSDAVSTGHFLQLAALEPSKEHSYSRYKTLELFRPRRQSRSERIDQERNMFPWQVISWCSSRDVEAVGHSWEQKERTPYYHIGEEGDGGCPFDGCGQTTSTLQLQRHIDMSAIGMHIILNFSNF